MPRFQALTIQWYAAAVDVCPHALVREMLRATTIIYILARARHGRFQDQKHFPRLEELCRNSGVSTTQRTCPFATVDEGQMAFLGFMEQ